MKVKILSSSDTKAKKLFNGLGVGFGPKGRSCRMCDTVWQKLGHTIIGARIAWTMSVYMKRKMHCIRTSLTVKKCQKSRAAHWLWNNKLTQDEYITFWVSFIFCLMTIVSFITCIWFNQCFQHELHLAHTVRKSRNISRQNRSPIFWYVVLNNNAVEHYGKRIKILHGCRFEGWPNRAWHCVLQQVLYIF